jgi:hypothetical protein
MSTRRCPVTGRLRAEDVYNFKFGGGIPPFVTQSLAVNLEDLRSKVCVRSSVPQHIRDFDFRRVLKTIGGIGPSMEMQRLAVLAPRWTTRINLSMSRITLKRWEIAKGVGFPTNGNETE